MKRRHVIFAVLVLLVVVGAKVVDHFLSVTNLPAAPLPRTRLGVAALKAVAPEVIDPSRKIRLAIGSLGLSDDGQNARLGDLILTELSSTRGLELVERREMDRILREAEMSLSGLVRAKDAVRAGKLLRADWFLLGTLSTATNKNTAIIARIVDAHTGIMRDLGVFPNNSSTQSAAQLSQFVKDCRAGAGNSNPREYLAIGTFQDVGVNNRLPDLPSQLQAQLAAAYQGSHITVLEREYMETLFNEAELDLAGLTDEAGKGPLPRLQTAFWLINGYYQSYERGDSQVELSLRVQRIFGVGTNFGVRAPFGEPLRKKLKSDLDAIFADHTTMLAPTRVTELKSQILAGDELASINEPLMIYSHFTFAEPECSIIRRNLNQAIQAFQTALLLDPTNREAKTSLAFCLGNPLIGRLDEARDIYRQIMDGGMRERWGRTAMELLSWSFNNGTASADFRSLSLEDKIRWWSRAAELSTNQMAAEFFKTKAKELERDLAIRQGTGTNAEALAEERLLQKIPDSINSDTYLREFMEVFGTNSATGVERLNALLPGIKTVTPSNGYPYVLASLVCYQGQTNSPVVVEFKSFVDWHMEHNQKVPICPPTPFWSHARGTAYDWAITNKDYDLAIKILSAKTRFEPSDSEFDRVDNSMSLAYLYLASQRWKDALGVFESWSNCPVCMGRSGLWGRAFTVVRTSKAANYCRKQLGLPEVHDPREFDLEDTGVCFCEPGNTFDGRPSGTFAVTEDSLWLGRPGRLFRLSFDLRTNLVVDLPVGPFTPTTVLCFGPNSVWAGTDAGLVEYDKSTGRCRLLTETDGLLMNQVAALKLIGDTLWVGFGHGGSGGIGKLDLTSGKFASFGKSILNTDTNRTATRGTVSSMAVGPNGDLYVMTHDVGIIRHRANADDWQQLPPLEGDYCIAAAFDRLFAGGRRSTYRVRLAPNESFEEYLRRAADFGVFSLGPKDGEWKPFPHQVQFPNQTVSIICADGEKLWAGGMGYVVLLDPAKEKVLRFSYIKCDHVDRIDVGGGCVWAQFGQHLFRAPLRNN